MELQTSSVPLQLFHIHTLLDWLSEPYLVGTASHSHKMNKQTKLFKYENLVSLLCFLCLPPTTGAGIFVTTVVAGSVALVKPFLVASRPFLRDVSFYMVAVFWTFLMLYRRTTTLGETLGTHTDLYIWFDMCIYFFNILVILV